MKKIVLLCTLAALLLSCTAKKSQTRVFGTEPTLKEAVTIATLNTEPAKFVDHDVLVAGRVANMCMHMGCWVEIEQADKSTIICKSLDESVLFSKDCLGKEIVLQGTLMYDPDAPGEVQEQKEGEAPHACPAPQVLVAIKGARVKGL
jgi:hypothetical protein